MEDDEGYTIEDVSSYSLDHIKNQLTVLSDENNINVLRYDVMLILKEYGLLSARDNLLMTATDIFHQLYVQDDCDVMEVYSSISDVEVVTRTDAIYLILAVRYKVPEAAWLLGNRSNEVWITDMSDEKVIDAYIEGVSMSNDIDKIEKVNRLYPSPLLWTNLVPLSTEFKVDVSQIIFDIFQTGSVEEITVLYNNLPRRVRNKVDVTILTQRFPHLNISTFDDFMDYTTTSDDLDIAVTAMKKGNYLYIPFVTSDDPVVYRSVGESNNAEMVRLFLMDRINPSYAYTEIIIGALPTESYDAVLNVLESFNVDISPLRPTSPTIADAQYASLNIADAQYASLNVDVVPIINRIVELGNDPSLYVKVPIDDNVLTDAVLRYGAVGYHPKLRKDRRLYLLAVEGGNMSYVESTRDSNYDDEALLVAARHNRVRVAEYILRTGSVSHNTLQQVLLTTTNPEIHELA